METEVQRCLISARKSIQDLYHYRNYYLNDLVNEFGIFEKNGPWIKSSNITDVIDKSLAKNKSKHQAIEDKLQLTLNFLSNSENIFSNATLIEKSEFYYLNGKAINIIQQDNHTNKFNQSDYDLDASKYLTKALKFNPMADYWCELGETLWRQNNPTGAFSHFQQALKVDPLHVSSLCNLSMIVRQLSSAVPNKDTHGSKQIRKETNFSAFNESLALAHKAVEQDPKYGHSWSVLGNAFLTLFFNLFGTVTPSKSQCCSDNSTNSEIQCGCDKLEVTSMQLTMKKCLAAYSQAVKDRCTALEPNFHYNRGIAFHYEDLFCDALRCWLTAVCLDPLWLAPQICLSRLVNFIMHFIHQSEEYQKTQSIETETSNSTCVSTDSKFNDFMQSLLPFSNLINGKSELNPKERAIVKRILGPYCQNLNNQSVFGNKQNSIKSKHRNSKKSLDNTKRASVKNNLNLCLLRDLKVGSNSESLCVGRVFAQLPSDSDLVLNLLLMDPSGHMLIARLFNIGKGLGPVESDMLVVPYPFIEEVNIDGDILHSSLLALKSLKTKEIVDIDSKLATLNLKTNVINSCEGDNDQKLNICDVNLRIMRVPIPDILVVNGSTADGAWTAKPALKNIFFTEN